MAGSSFSKRHYASAFVLSAALVLLSGVYFHQLWRGVVVSDAGDAGAVSVAFGKEFRTNCCCFTPCACILRCSSASRIGSAGKPVLRALHTSAQKKQPLDESS